MAQRTVTTRQSAAQAARKNLKAEIASHSPPADSEVPPLDISPPSLPHQVHDRSGAPDMDTPAPGIAQLLHQQQPMMATLVDFLPSTERQPSVIPSLAPRVTSARPWKTGVPVLPSPEDSDLTSFTDWRTRWADYLSLTRAMGGIETLTARLDLLHSALHPDWTVLWQTGRLDVQADDDIDAIVPKLERYLRIRRNPLLDRQEFFSRAQGEHGNIDQFVAALVWLHDRCAFDDDAKGRCDNCGHSFNHSSHLRDLCLQDQVVRGLSDVGMQRRVLMEEYDQHLTLHRTLQICQGNEASRVTEQALNQDNPLCEYDSHLKHNGCRPETFRALAN